MITRGSRLRPGTRMARTAAAIHFAGGDAGEANTRTFGTPDRTIAIPDGNGRTDETLAGRNSGQKKKKQRHIAQLACRLAAAQDVRDLARPKTAARRRATFPLVRYGRENRLARLFYFCSHIAMSRFDIDDMASAILAAPGWVRVGITAPARHIRDDAARELARAIAETLDGAQIDRGKSDRQDAGL